MYLGFFGLRERPFELTPDPRFIYLSDQHVEALSVMHHGIVGRKGITLIVGEAGTGKTTVVRAALQAVESPSARCVYLSNPVLTRAEFYEFLAVSFGLPPKVAASKTRFLFALEPVLVKRGEERALTVLVIDEAQSLPLELLEEVRLLANLETPTEKLLPVVLAGQPELADMLERPELRQLKQRVALRADLAPLNVRQTAAYVAGRIRRAGGEPTAVFTKEAVVRIWSKSGGIPRSISVICDNALIAAYAAGTKPVGPDLVEEAAPGPPHGRRSRGQAVSSLHKALERAAGGPPEILPPGTAAPDGAPPQTDQSAFAVPWPINDADRPAGARREPARESETAPETGAMPDAAGFEVHHAEIGERLVGMPRAGDGADRALAVEQYRRLAAALHQAQAARGTRVVLVTSADPGEGKSLTACNLALTLAESYRLRALLVDADFRRPTLHGVFGGQPSSAGGGAGAGLPLGLAAVQASPRLTVFVSSGPVADPTAALTSSALGKVLEDARARFDWVIIDTPPIGLMSDAKLLADMTDGAIVVVQAERSPYPGALRAIETIGRERVLGVVLNRLRDVARRYHYYSGYYYRGSRAPSA
jgi:general secretion pathway protein A